MNVLSLFDGMSCGQIALNRAGIKYDNYFAAEIKPHAIKVTQHNYPNTIHIGDVRKIHYENGILEYENVMQDVGRIDVLIGGSPCQDLSIANKNRTGLKGEKSSLFWEYARILKEVRPKYFLLENVEMPDEDKQVITEELQVYPVNINSSLVSAQYRNRYYWTNIQGDEISMFGNLISQPKDKRIKLQNILESGYTDKEKARCLVTKNGASIKNQKSVWHRYTTTGMVNVVFVSPDLDWQKGLRFFTKTEMERLQTVPEGYTEILNEQQALNVLGDGWTVDVIAHIFKGLKNKNTEEVNE